MSYENIQLKIDLLQEQIDNLERSGFFTEKEINSRSIPLKTSLARFTEAKRLFKLAKRSRRMANHFLFYAQLGFSTAAKEYGMAQESYEEGKRIHDELFSNFKVLTPNQQEA